MTSMTPQEIAGIGLTTPRRSFWVYYPRDFANEYSIALATTAEHRKAYDVAGWERVTRREAERLARVPARTGWGTENYVSREVDGRGVGRYEFGLAVARA